MNTTGDEAIFDGMDEPRDSNATTDSEATGDSSGSDSAETELLKSELTDAQERAIRIAAELDNFRKRSRRELEDALKYAQLPLIRELLGVVDNLQRALGAATDADQAGGLIEGVRMVAGQLQGVLKNYHCEAIPALGEPFDPTVHEALQMEPSDEHAANTVSRELSTGYRVHDRVVRPAQVFVSTGPATAAE